MDKKFVKLAFIVLPMLLSLYAQTPEQNRDPIVELKGFEDFILQQMAEWKVPGCAVAIVREGKIIFSEGFGIRDTQKESPVTSQTLFAIGSSTKAFTAAAIGILADEGKIDWDRPIKDFIPSFKLYDPDVTERVTIRDLLCHRTGLARHDVMWYGSSFTRKEIFERLRYLEPSQDFRSTWQYSNILYSAAGYCIELITGKTWEEFVKERIFCPLGMNRSNFSFEESKLYADFALPYTSREGEAKELPFRNLTNIGPAGSIQSSIADLTRWILFNLQKGKWEERQILSEANINLIHSPQIVILSPIQDDELLHSCYGMGWAINPYQGHLMVHHGGGIEGFASYICLFPRDNIGLAILANLTGTPLVQIIAYDACDRLLGLKPVAWDVRFKNLMEQFRSTMAKSREENSPDPKVAAQPSRPLPDYEGDYENPGYGVLTVRVEENQLIALLNGIELPLKHFRHDVFEIGEVRHIVPLKGKKALFIQDQNGDISRVTLPLEPQVKDITFLRIPEKSLTELSLLLKFVGKYEISGMTFSIFLKGENTLAMTVPGQLEYELLPSKNSEFQVKNVSGFSIKFLTGPHGDVKEALLTMPNGTFSAKKK